MAIAVLKKIDHFSSLPVAGLRTYFRRQAQIPDTADSFPGLQRLRQTIKNMGGNPAKF